MGTIRWTDYRGKEHVRETKHIINIDDFKGMAGYPLLLVAANRHLSINLLVRLLEQAGGSNKRSNGWVQRRRWMFEDPDEIRHESRDPNDARAVAIMRQHPNMSLRELARLLASNGIRRGKDWVRQHRCD